LKGISASGFFPEPRIILTNQYPALPHAGGRSPEFYYRKNVFESIGDLHLAIAVAKCRRADKPSRGST